MDTQNLNLTCVICLDHFKIPVTIPCGHTFCQGCISAYWDRGLKSEQHQCPICSTKFDSRPMLKRNVSLSVLTEAANSSACRESLLRGGEGVRAMQLCDRHKKPLVYYCKQDRTSVCHECGICECKNHEKVLLETERENQEVCWRAAKQRPREYSYKHQQTSFFTIWKADVLHGISNPSVWNMFCHVPQT